MDVDGKILLIIPHYPVKEKINPFNSFWEQLQVTNRCSTMKKQIVLII
jgi:hypothetical protein